MKEKIEHLLTEAFNPTYLEVIDESPEHAGHSGALEGGHYQVTIVSGAFKGKKLIESHRLVYQALSSVKSSIHALAIKTSSV